MKKITSQKFSKRLAQYGALSVAIAGVAGANAQDQIGYTNIDPDYSGTPDPYYVIDFDGDAIGDLVIVSYASVGILAFAYGSNKVLGSVNSYVSSSNTYGLVYPFALDSGAVISAGQNSWLNSTDFYSGANILNGFSCSYGVWCDVQDKFIGVQFKIGSNIHYGWARLDVATNGNIWTLKDFAYNKTPDASINAGQTTSLGIENNETYLGADDNGSGTVAILEMAEAFKQAELEGNGPKRSVLFLHLTAEEIGLQGSLYYTQNPIFKLEKTIANINIDMIGRVDNMHEDDPNYIYIIGSDRLSKELHYINEKVNSYTQNLKLEYKYNEENDSNRYYYRSDHYNFAKHNIPVIFYFNGEHDDYHKPSDTPNKINYDLLEKRTKLIFATAWQLANQENRLLMNIDF